MPPVSRATRVRGRSERQLIAVLAVIVSTLGCHRTQSTSDDSPTGPSPTSTLTLSVAPTGIGVHHATNFTFTASGGASGSAYNWNFGDGVTASGPAASAVHVYNQAGVFSAQVQATDPHGTVTSASATGITVKTIAGTWELVLTPRPDYTWLYCTRFTAVLTQTDDQVRGSLTPTTCAAGHTNLTSGYSEPIYYGNVSDPRQAMFGNESPRYDELDDIYWTATIDDNLNTMQGPCTKVCQSMFASRK
jgi:hypothetical protein